MLGLAVQPPAQARPGSPLYPPLAARLSSDKNIFDQLSNTWAVATLVHQSGKILDDQLGGRVADSAHPLPEIGSDHHRNHSSEKDRAYFYFPDLTIYEPGRYRIRVSLMQMDYSCDTSPDGIVRVCECIESRSIFVDDRAENSGRPSSQERAFLRVLKNDGQEIPHPFSSG